MLPGFLPMIVYLIWWIIKRKSYHRHIVYRFSALRFPSAREALVKRAVHHVTLQPVNSRCR